MAPPKTNKTPRPATKFSNAKISKRPSQANKSILNFFQKVDPPEDSMFVGGEAGLAAANPSMEVKEDIYVADEYDPVLEERYNEAQLSNKRRKLSDVENAKDDIAVPPPPKANTEGRRTTPARSSQPKRPRKKGPFLDDSDSESEHEATDNGNSPDGKGPKEVSAAKDQEVRPAITFTEEHKRTSLTLAPDAVSRTNPPILKNEPSTIGDNGDFADQDDDFNNELFEGEELREMLFMREQARLEAEEAGIQHCDDGLETLMEDDGMAESCPICNASLAGVTPNQAIVHVNSCLDGNPTPLPTNNKPKAQSPPTEPPQIKSRSPSEGKDDLVSGPEMGKRFARAAVARPGQLNPISLGEGEPSTNGDGGGSTSAFSKLMSGHAEDAAWATAAATESASRGKPAYQRTCPFYKIMPGFHICVDAFRYGAVEGCRAYFLSHFHSDHYIGLTANWTHGPIYCSKVTGSLVKSQLKTAEKYVVELEFEKKVPVPSTEGVFVTMIPANHCPGSSLFLFEKAVSNPNPHANSKEKKVQRILHCGDFRACPAHIEHPQLKPETIDALGKVKQQKIDVCYLDTTYLNPRYSFPPQNDVIRACADLCLDLDTSLRAENESEWYSVLRRREGRGIGNNDTVSRFFVTTDKAEGHDASSINPKDSPEGDTTPTAFTALGQKARENRNRLLVVCGTYSIGKERICKAIALALKTKIFASPAKIRMCSQLGDPELAALMTSSPHEAQVHMQMLMELRAETLAEYLDHHRPHFGRVILHGPAWRTRFGMRDLVPQQGSSKEAMCFGVPYSEHSSFRELMLFVMGLRIEKIVPTVNVGSEPSRKRMKGWTDRWLSERRRGGVVRVFREVGDGGEDGLGEDGEVKGVKSEEDESVLDR
ncbi:DNA cross-link repair 1A protein [Cytospora mali]|uniref:DNA cross-link repair 1A protein n=1 Tax=Cytospora mali TaxID=578113 RepID=A0A194VAP2_CYTMA|nr:DNA cross-link repair 1A protein [Valsa mali var. pyri (nom. inval.)]